MDAESRRTESDPVEIAEPDPVAQFRHLPPRITPDEMITTQAVSSPDTSELAGTEDERAIRRGWVA
jgi:hypothetical protein